MPGLIDLNQLAPQLAAARSGGSGGGGGGPLVGAPAPGGSGDSLPPPLANILKQILLSDVKSRFSTGTDPRGAKWRPLKFARPNGGDVPLRDTGVLMASFTGGSDGKSVWVGTTHPGAKLHNFGGVVRGKGKMLAIPLTKEAKRSGGPRRWKGGELQFRLTRKPRVFLLMSVAGGGRGSGATGKPRKAKKRGAAKIDVEKLVAQFLLVDQVRVPQREFMGVSEKAWGQINDAVGEFAARGWLGGGRGGFGVSVG
jgi:phage gpG-like protein